MATSTEEYKEHWCIDLVLPQCMGNLRHVRIKPTLPVGIQGLLESGIEGSKVGSGGMSETKYGA